jgi:hypothetical protein
MHIVIVGIERNHSCAYNRPTYLFETMFIGFSMKQMFDVNILVEVDDSMSALICTLLPESTSEEMLFITINPYSGLFCVMSYIGKRSTRSFVLRTRLIIVVIDFRDFILVEARFCQQIEQALNREPTTLVEAIHSLKYVETRSSSKQIV